MKTFNLSTEERLTLENNLLKEQNLSLQISELQKQRHIHINQICDRLGHKAESITDLNVQTGTIAFAEESDLKIKKK